VQAGIQRAFGSKLRSILVMPSEQAPRFPCRLGCDYSAAKQHRDQLDGCRLCRWRPRRSGARARGYARRKCGHDFYRAGFLVQCCGGFVRSDFGRRSDVPAGNKWHTISAASLLVSISFCWHCINFSTYWLHTRMFRACGTRPRALRHAGLLRHEIVHNQYVVEQLKQKGAMLSNISVGFQPMRRSAADWRTLAA
jgi:hypothetical protein